MLLGRGLFSSQSSVGPSDDSSCQQPILSNRFNTNVSKSRTRRERKPPAAYGRERRRAAENSRAGEDRDPIDEAGVEKTSERFRSAFDQNARDLAPGHCRGGAAQIHSPLSPR